MNVFLEFFISAAKWRSDVNTIPKLFEILMNFIALVSEILALNRVISSHGTKNRELFQKHLFWSGYPYRIRRFKGTPTSHEISDPQKCFSKWMLLSYLCDSSMTHQWLMEFHTKKYTVFTSYFKYAVLFQKYIIENSRSLSNTVSYRYLSSMDMIRIFFRNHFSNLTPLYFRFWIFEYLETVIFRK